MTSAYLDLPVRSFAQAVAERRFARDRLDGDVDVLDGLLEQAHAFKAAVLAAAPDLHHDLAREMLARFGVQFDDFVGDTIGGARHAVEGAIDDTMPAGVP